MLPLLCAAFLRPDVASFQAEADRLTDETISTFYDAKAKIWKPKGISADAVGDQGYTFWPSLVAWQAIIEGAKVEPRRWKPRIAPFFDALEKYFDRRSHAYCAWTYFPGNDDHFYDDNTWAVIACMEAYETTGETRYYGRATDILDNFIHSGWDPSNHPGGMKWGTKNLPDRHDRTISATAAGALAALCVSKVRHSAADRRWAKQEMDWIRNRLSSDSGLIYDGLKSPQFTRMNTIWTYNTGVPIRAAVDYYHQTKDPEFLKWAVKMGDAAIDRNLAPMYDSSVKSPDNRYWWDSTFFVHYLVDGLRLLSQTTGDQKYVRESVREADYCVAHLKDADGLYWRNMRLWSIDAETQREFVSLTGQTVPDLVPDASERSADPAAMKEPVEKRPMVKTVLANAGVARMLWLLSH